MMGQMIGACGADYVVASGVLIRKLRFYMSADNRARDGT
jgi:hypothetical protein